ncbi:hypothetical protein ACIGO6_39685 [Streptomyces sp. NPDC053750]|uniref:hypothetical protein n=1 Tax=Streptomyces sp. NPDC053750 TaxID=3365714 RepID=UPI0037D32033
MGISKRKSKSTLVSGVVVVGVLLATLTGCGDDDAPSDAEPKAKSSATASATSASPSSVSPSPEEPVVEEPEETASAVPEKVTLSLAEIADTPGTFDQFKAFVAKHGTAEQKKAVQHLKGWRGYERKLAYPALEASSDYPTVDYEAIDGGDQAEVDKMMGLETQSQHLAEALAAWWDIDETAVLQVYDRTGEYAAGTACIRPDSVSQEGSCL